MFARKVAAQDEVGGDLFAGIGVFLRAQGLAPEPANYAFAHRLLTRRDEEAMRIVAQVLADGVRLSRRDMEALGGAPVAGPAAAPPAAPSRRVSSRCAKA